MKIVYAKSSCWTATPEGIPWYVNFGSHWAAEDPLVRMHPELFTEDPLYGLNYSDGYKPDEMATATPGERRAVRRS